ncbi:MAG: hypothetical protein AABY22_07200 [Nanoarchaeota archaeon]
MNQKDYEAIAEILKRNSGDKDIFGDGNIHVFDIINQLADYFEEEAFRGFNKEGKVASEFNREQFLKEAGVQ